MSEAGFDSRLVGRAVVDAGGESIGNLSTLYLDLDTGAVAFAGVAMLRRGRRRVVFVPLADAALTTASITVTCGKELARRAPSVRPGEALPADAEPNLFAHYGLRYGPRDPDDGRRLSRYV